MINKKREMVMWGTITTAIYLLLIFKGFLLEPDAFWQIKLGEWVIENRSVISIDQFSWINQEMGIDVFSHSWLGSIIIYLFSLISTPKLQYLGVFIFQLFWGFIFILTLNSIVIKRLAENGKDYITGLVFLLLPVLISVFPTTRPQMISNTLFFLVIYILDCWETNHNTKKIFFLPLISVLWANIHGGTAPMILIFVAAHIIVSFISIECGQITCERFGPISKRKKLKNVLPLIATMILSAIMMCMNPYGFKILTYSFLYNNSACKEGVGEWQPSTLFSSFGIILMIMIVLVVILSEKKVSLNRIVDVSICAALTLVYVRGTSYLGIATSLFFARYLICKLPDLPTNKYSYTKKTILLSIITVIIAALGITIFFPKQYNKVISTFEYSLSDEMIGAIKDNDFKRLYNDYNIGGYLIYNEIPVFIDSRADLYTEDVLRDGKNLPGMNGLNPKETLDKYNFDGLVVENDCPLYYYLLSLGDGEYKKICSDENYTLFKK